MDQLTQDQRRILLKEVQDLEATLCGDLMSDMDIKDKIHNIKMKLNGTKPVDSYYDCIGCGS